MNYYVTDNTGASVALNDIPEVSYAAFYEDLRVKLSDARYHAAHYFALPSGDRMRFFLLLLDDAEAGRGLVLIDPKGDLITDLLAILDEHEPRIPEPWAPSTRVDADLLALTGQWYWGPSPYVLRVLPDGLLDLVPWQ